MKIDVKKLMDNLHPKMSTNQYIIKALEELIDNKSIIKFDFDGQTAKIFLSSIGDSNNQDIIEINFFDDNLEILSKVNYEPIYGDLITTIKKTLIKRNKFNDILGALIESEYFIIFNQSLRHCINKINVLDSNLETNYCQESSFYDEETLNKILGNSINEYQFSQDINFIYNNCSELINKLNEMKIKKSKRKDIYVDRLNENPLYARVVVLGDFGNYQYYAVALNSLKIVSQHDINSKNILLNKPGSQDREFIKDYYDNHITVMGEEIYQQYCDLDDEKAIQFDNFKKSF